tara:strand:+ start:272 stop:514 length:243 start_codon:yes stop_codon:yes gene_type:complete
MYNNRKITVINASDVSSVDFSQVLETSADTLRYNNDNTKTFVKYDGTQPSFLSGKTEYSYDDFVAILQDEEGEWYPEELK